MDKDREITLSSIESNLVEAIKRRGPEIEKVLTVLKESHGLNCCQVWIQPTVKNENVEDSVKLAGGYTPDFKDYYDACVKIQDGLGGLAMKAYDTYQAYLSRNVSDKGELHTLLPAATSESGCIAICLRNVETQNLDYAFEFFFSSSLYDNNNNPCAFLESLFSKLETCLPSFKFSSGAQLGRELLVINADNLTKSFYILASKQQKEKEDCAGSLLRRSKMLRFWNSINRATVEIQEAISSLTESRGLTLCQVWMYPYVFNENEKCAIKLDGYCSAAFKDYYDACFKIQDGAGRLALKTFVTKKPYFSRKINVIFKGVPATTAESSTCCFSICLRSSYTGHQDFVFEFFFSLHDNKDPYVFLDSLLATLETCFPNFKLSSGEQLGRQLKVLDGDNLAANFDFIAFLKQDDCDDDDDDHDDDCMKEIDNQLYKHYNGTSFQAMDVSASMKFADLKTKISERFHLVSSAYRLSYLVNKGSIGHLWFKIEGDRDFKKYISFCPRKRSTRLLIRVLPCTISNEERVQKRVAKRNLKREKNLVKCKEKS